jgi:hypothetical protein
VSAALLVAARKAIDHPPLRLGLVTGAACVIPACFWHVVAADVRRAAAVRVQAPTVDVVVCDVEVRSIRRAIVTSARLVATRFQGTSAGGARYFPRSRFQERPMNV